MSRRTLGAISRSKGMPLIWVSLLALSGARGHGIRLSKNGFPCTDVARHRRRGIFIYYGISYLHLSTCLLPDTVGHSARTLGSSGKPDLQNFAPRPSILDLAGSPQEPRGFGCPDGTAMHEFHRSCRQVSCLQMGKPRQWWTARVSAAP